MSSADRARESLLKFWVIGEPMETLRQRIADDKDLMRVIANTSPENVALDQTCRILFAAMDYLGEKHGFEIPADETWTSFRRFRKSLLEHDNELLELLQRPVQVNDPLRCVALYAGLLFAAAQTSLPLALVEVGPSLGLNLCMDRYCYEYLNLGKTGQLDSRCLLIAELDNLAARGRLRKRQTFQFPDKPPVIGERIGLELHPVRMNDNNLAWMRSFHFRHSKSRFDEALAIRLTTSIRIVEGNAAETLQREVSHIPADQVPLVFHTAVAYQMPESVREQFSRNLATAARGRRLIYMTWAEETARRGAILQVTDLNLAEGHAQRNLLAFASRWEPVPKIDWVHAL